MPMFLFSATFFPIIAYPQWLRSVWSRPPPLYRGVVLCREFATGHLTSASFVSVVYLVAIGWIGLSVVSRRLEKLLLTSGVGRAGLVVVHVANSVFACLRAAREVSDVIRDNCEERGACDEGSVLGCP